MSSDSFDRIERLFQAALALDPEDRNRFLDSACAENPSLRSELEGYLEADSDAEEENYLLSPFTSIGESPGSAPESISSLNRQIGPYSVVKTLGHGGMGDVYLALQTSPFKRYVALKIIRQGMDFNAVLQRFDMERQILASLNHPHIARLISGGATSDGLPYFAMEYIDGVSITTYCDNNSFSIEKRLSLFLSVCEAVDYAHQNLVLHRDLKPSNIMVNKEGEVTLLDFGIAKLLNPGMSHLTMPVTQFDGRLMTPDYASPEQVRGESLSTATDVYSLGVVLYELLTGHLPHQLKRRTTEELLKVICEVDPERPSIKIRHQTLVKRTGQDDIDITPDTVSKSRNSSVEKLHKVLRGDLDNIVMKALRKEPGRRYTGPKHLGEDIERFLNGLPVEAHQDSRSYRFMKLVRRRKVETAALCLILVTLAGGMASTMWQADVATSERDAAREALQTASAELRKSESITAFLMDLFEASDPNETQGDTITAQELLQRGLDRVENLSDQPQVHAQMLDVIGGVYFRLSEYNRARELYEEAYRIRRDHFEEAHTDIGISYFHRGDVHLALGNHEAAQTFLQKAVDHQRKHSPSSLALVNSLTMLADTYFEQSQYDEVERYIKEALDTHRRSLSADSVDLLDALTLLASTKMQLGLVDESTALYERTLAIQQRAEKRDPMQMAVTLNNLGLLLRRYGDYDKAEPYLRDALDLLRRVVGNYQINVGRALHNLATLYFYKNELPRADSLFQASLDVYGQTLPEEHAWRALTLHNYSRVLRDQGRLDEAERMLKQALAIQERLFPGEHFHKAMSLQTLGGLYLLMGQYKRAGNYLDQAMGMQQRLLGSDHADLGRTLQVRARLHVALGEKQTAREEYLEAQRIYTGKLLDSHRWVRELKAEMRQMETIP